MDLHAVATFPEGILWRSGVSLQNTTSITTHLHLYICRDRASQTEDRTSQTKSSVDFLPFEIERGYSPTFGVPSSPKWEIIHAHSLSGRFSTLVCLNILARGEQLDPLRPLSQSVTDRTVFRSFVLQIETLVCQPNHLSKSVTGRAVSLPFLLWIETFVD